MSAPIRHLSISQRPVFLVNSRLGLFTAATSRWLPFSRSYGVILPSSLTRVLPFVLEFSSRLPVSVCGTGTSKYLAAFLAGVDSKTSFPLSTPHHSLTLRLAYFTTSQSHCLDALFQPRASSIFPCHCFIISLGSTGISTCCPSATPFGLALGPDLPWADEPSPGNLRFSTARILTLLSLLIPAFSLLPRPHLLSVMLHPTAECSSTTVIHLTKVTSLLCNLC